jgi:hypothetical protein
MDKYQKGFDDGVKHERRRLLEINTKFINSLLDVLEAYTNDRDAEITSPIKEE